MSHDDYLYLGYATHKMKLTSYVEWWEKMGAYEERGYYAVLELNQCEIYRWKLSQLDQDLIFQDQHLMGQLTEDEIRHTRTANKNALDGFIANRISDVFTSVFAGGVLE